MSARAEMSKFRSAVLPVSCALVLQAIALWIYLEPAVGQNAASAPAEVSAMIERVRLGPPTDGSLAEALSVGRSLLRAGRYAEAAELYKVLLEKWPRHAGALYGAALSTFNLGRSTDAEPLARAAAALSLANVSSEQNGLAREQWSAAADALVLWAVIRAVQGDDARALEIAKRAVEIAPQHFDAQFTLGRALYSTGDSEAAARAFRAAVAINPQDARALFFLATVLERANNLDEALTTYRRLTTLQPKNADGHLGLGVLLVKRGGASREEGIGELRRAIELKPDLYEARVTLGRTLVAQGRAAEALDHLLNAAKLAPGNPEPHFQLSLAYRRLGRVSQAAEEAAIVKKIHEARRASSSQGSVPRTPNN